jgi:arginase
MMTATVARGLHVVPVRYGGSAPNTPDREVVDSYAAAADYGVFGAEPTISEPQFPEDKRDEEPTINLGLIGGEIANAVAEGRREGKPVLVVGGNCAITPGVVGGLQQAHGPAAKIGLVWFDAHGDFNTPRTTLSGMLGGMPVAVTAGLAWPRWRELSLQPAPLPTDRIVMVDVRNLDPAEETLVRATDVVIAAPAAGFPGENLQEAIANLAERCDMIYLHIDSDILDASLTPNHGTKEPNGPDVAQTVEAIGTVMATGKVVALGLVSINSATPGGDVTLASGIAMLRGGLERWG